MAQRTFTHNAPFALELGGELPGFSLGYSLHGNLATHAHKVVWVGLMRTLGTDMAEWWPGLFSPGKLFDPAHHVIVCADMLGGQHGATGPLSTNPATGNPYYHDFPAITHRDVVRTYALLQQHLGISKIHTFLGVSMGGQQGLEWAITQPDNIERLVLLGTNARQSPWCIAANETQRMAIGLDPSWAEDGPDAGLNGLRTARALALLNFRSYENYTTTQAEPTTEKLDGYLAASYQQYQGEKFTRRFNAYAYWNISKTMDSHNVGRGRQGIPEALGQIKAQTLVMSMSDDSLYPPEEQEFLAQHIPGAAYHALTTHKGHDSFFDESAAIATAIRQHFKP